jgi:phage/plasmid-associated DNA primase
MGRRLRIIKFPFTFTDNPKPKVDPNDPEEKEERKVDRTLGGKIMKDIRYRQAFAKILINNWKNVKGLGALKAPEEVMEASLQYLKDSNDVYGWITENYIYDTKTRGNINGLNEKEDREKVKDLFAHFKSDNYKSSLDIKKFVGELNKLNLYHIKPGNVSIIQYIKKKPDGEDGSGGVAAGS